MRRALADVHGHPLRYLPVVVLPLVFYGVYTFRLSQGASEAAAQRTGVGMAVVLGVNWLLLAVWVHNIRQRRARAGRRAASEARAFAVREVARSGGIERWVLEELRDALFAAEVTDSPAAARRCAELYELAAEVSGDPAWFRIAARWWRQAASMGDPDAVEYVRALLEEDGR